MTTGGDTRDSHRRYLRPDPDRQRSRLRQHPELPALQVVAGGETAAIIEEHPDQAITVRGLLVDALRRLDARLVLPAAHLAQARWRREHRSKPWSEVPPALRASLLTQAETDLIAARGLDDRHDWHPRIELVVVEDPDEGPQTIRVWVDGVEVTSTSVTEVRIDPGRGHSPRDWDQLGRHLATTALSPGARDVAALEHASWVDSTHTTASDPQ